ncbi:hypothetical protein [Streptomyces parvus]|uniref:hypothetical protein n=1 Tax=Streptomyces parvus TaxID=66428 RepID=UPI0035D98DB6
MDEPTTPTPADRPADQLRAAVWVDGDPLMEATACAVWEQCRTENSIVVDDPRNIAAVAATVARQLLGTTAAEDVTPSADRRDRYAAAIRETDGWVLDDGQHMIDAVMAVADSEIAAAHTALRRGNSRLADENARLHAAAPPAPADRAAEVEDLRAELDKLIRWHKEDGAQAIKAAATIKRLRAERAELNRRLDCLRGDMRDMESSLREQDAEFERIRRLADGAAAGVQPPTSEADTLAPWLYQRFMVAGAGWDQLDEDDRSYWEHHARAVRRAVARGGFKTPATPPAAPAAPEEQNR